MTERDPTEFMLALAQTVGLSTEEAEAAIRMQEVAVVGEVHALLMSAQAVKAMREDLQLADVAMYGVDEYGRLNAKAHPTFSNFDMTTPEGKEGAERRKERRALRSQHGATGKLFLKFMQQVTWFRTLGNMAKPTDSSTDDAEDEESEQERRMSERLAENAAKAVEGQTTRGYRAQKRAVAEKREMFEEALAEGAEAEA